MKRLTTDGWTNRIYMILFTNRGCNCSKRLTDGVTHQIALICTYFPLLETYRVLQTLIVRQPKHVHNFTYKRFLLNSQGTFPTSHTLIIMKFREQGCQVCTEA